MLNAVIKRNVIHCSNQRILKQFEIRKSCMCIANSQYETSQFLFETSNHLKNLNRQFQTSRDKKRDKAKDLTNRSKKFSSSLARYEYVEVETVRKQRMNHSIEKPSQHLCSLLDDIIAGREIGEKNVNTARCNAVIKALQGEGTLEAYIYSELILEKMEKIGKLIGDRDLLGRPTAVPDFFTYWSHIKFYLRKGNENYTQKAHNLLERMENNVYCDVEMPRIHDAFQRGIIFAKPDRGNQSDRADICERAFMEMKEPTTRILNWVLRLWVKSSNKNATGRAEDLLRTVAEWSMIKEQYSECKPDLVSFNTVLTAYAEKGQGQKAQLMYDLMEDLYAQGILAEKPDFVSHLSLLSVYGGKQYFPRYPHQAAVKAEQMLNKLIQLCANDDSNGDLKPQLFVMAIKAWGKCRNAEGVEKARNILAKMKDLGVKENTFVYNAFLETIARSNIENAHLRTADVINYMREEGKKVDSSIKPDFVSYTSYIKSLLSSSTDGVYHAMDVIKQLESDFADGISNIKPDNYMYSTLLSIFKREPTEKNIIEELLVHMENRYEKGHTDAKPTLPCYRIVLESWLLSADPTRGEKAFSIFQKCEKNLQNDSLLLSDYNMVLETCATVKTNEEDIQKKNLSIVLELYRKILLSPTLKPSSETYYFLLVACIRLIPDAVRQRKTMGKFVQHCKKDGLLSNDILMLLNKTFSSKFISHLIGSENKHYNDLPKNWTRNCVRKENSIRFGRMNRLKTPNKTR